ncbi:MAG: hypothetical protein C5B43_00005, partial [Verrucomicrobia bacterium]
MVSKFHDFCRYFKNINLGFVLLFSVLILTFLGLVVLASASLSFSQASASIFNKQLLWLFAGLIGGIVMFLIDLEKLREFSKLIAVGTVLLLVLV